MVRLGFLHPPLPVFVVEELKHLLERLLRIVHDVGERSALPIFNELFACDGHFRHFGTLAI